MQLLVTAMCLYVCTDLSFKWALRFSLFCDCSEFIVGTLVCFFVSNVGDKLLQQNRQLNYFLFFTFVPFILVLSKFYLFTNRCTSELS